MLGERERRFKADSMNRVPVPNDAFGVTVCLETLVHADDPRATVKELERITRPGGLVICNFSTSHTMPVDLAKSVLVEGLPRTVSLGLEWLGHRKDGFVARTTYYLPWMIDRIIRDSGLEAIERESFAHGLYTFFVLEKPCPTRTTGGIVKTVWR